MLVLRIYARLLRGDERGGTGDEQAERKANPRNRRTAMV